MRTRFAPSPTGPLHLGHAFSAVFAADMARRQNGAFLLRIEDVDQTRARAQWETQIYADLAWLGLTWPCPVLRQSERVNAYRNAVNILLKQNLLYQCSCRRRDIESAVSAPQEGAPLLGPDGIVYPGTCRPNINDEHAPETNTVPELALRLNMRRAFDILPEKLSWREGDKDMSFGREVIDTIGDIVVVRRDFGTSYHLSVVVDDAAQGITDVTRGADLQEATAIHVVLQNLLGLPQPRYHHHRLIRDAAGKRLAKRNDALSLATLRSQGMTPADIRAQLELGPAPS